MRSRARRLAVDYGLTVEDVDAMHASQGGRCACCGTTKPGGHGAMHVDHDHRTGVVRGLVCHNCNRGIGLLGDSIEGVSRALLYLERAEPPLLKLAGGSGG